MRKGQTDKPDDTAPGGGEPVVQPIDGELDLHTFRPSEIGSLIPEYLRECRRLGIRRVRIVHGKGTGALRESVHAILRRLPEVRDFALGSEHDGGWGATVVFLA